MAKTRLRKFVGTHIVWQCPNDPGTPCACDDGEGDAAWNDLLAAEKLLAGRKTLADAQDFICKMHCDHKGHRRICERFQKALGI